MSEFLNDQQNSSLSSQLQNTHKSTKQSTYFNHEFSSSSLLYSQPILLYIKNLRPELVALSKLIYENNHPTEIANVLKTLERIAVGVLKDDGRDTKILTEKRRITGNLLCESNVVYALTSLFSSLAVLSIVAKDDDMRSCNSPFFQQAVILRSYFTTLAKSSSSAEFDFFSRNFRGLDDMLAVITNFVGRSSSVLADTNNIPSIGDLCNMVFLQSNSSGDTVSLIDRGRRMNDWMILLHLLFTTLAVLADVSEECFVVVHTNIFQSDYVLPVLLLSPAHQPTAITLIRKFLSRALSFLNQQRSQTAQQSVVHVDHIGGIITPLLIALHLIPYETETGLLLPILNALHSSLKLSYLVQNVFVEIRGIQTLFFIMREVMKMKPSKAPSSHTPSNSLTDNEIFLPTLSIYLMCLRCFTVSVSNNKRNKARVRDGGEIIPQMIRILVASGLFNEFRCAYLICETLFDMMHDIDKERLSISTFSPSDGGAESYSYPDSERLDNALFTPSDVGPVMFGSAAKILIHVCVCVPDDVADAVWERMVELAEFSNENTNLFCSQGMLFDSLFLFSKALMFESHHLNKSVTRFVSLLGLSRFRLHEIKYFFELLYISAQFQNKELELKRTNELDFLKSASAYTSLLRLLLTFIPMEIDPPCVLFDLRSESHDAYLRLHYTNSTTRSWPVDTLHGYSLCFWMKVDYINREDSSGMITTQPPGGTSNQKENFRLIIFTATSPDFSSFFELSFDPIHRHLVARTDKKVCSGQASSGITSENYRLSEFKFDPIVGKWHFICFVHKPASMISSDMAHVIINGISYSPQRLQYVASTKKVLMWWGQRNIKTKGSNTGADQTRYPLEVLSDPLSLKGGKVEAKGFNQKDLSSSSFSTLSRAFWKLGSFFLMEDCISYLHASTLYALGPHYQGVAHGDAGMFKNIEGRAAIIPIPNNVVIPRSYSANLTPLSSNPSPKQQQQPAQQQHQSFASSLFGSLSNFFKGGAVAEQQRQLKQQQINEAIKKEKAGQAGIVKKKDVSISQKVSRISSVNLSGMSFSDIANAAISFSPPVPEFPIPLKFVIAFWKDEGAVSGVVGDSNTGTTIAPSESKHSFFSPFFSSSSQTNLSAQPPSSSFPSFSSVASCSEVDFLFAFQHEKFYFYFNPSTNLHPDPNSLVTLVKEPNLSPDLYLISILPTTLAAPLHTPTVTPCSNCVGGCSIHPFPSCPLLFLLNTLGGPRILLLLLDMATSQESFSLALRILIHAISAYPPIGHILSNTGDILLLTHILERKCSCLSPSSLLDLSSFVLLLLSFASPSYIPGDASCFASVSYRNTTNHFISILTTLNGVDPSSLTPSTLAISYSPYLNSKFFSQWPILLHHNRPFNLLSLHPFLILKLSPSFITISINVIKDLVSPANPYCNFNRDRLRETATFATIIFLLYFIIKYEINTTLNRSSPPSRIFSPLHRSQSKSGLKSNQKKTGGTFSSLTLSSSSTYSVTPKFVPHTSRLSNSTTSIPAGAPPSSSKASTDSLFDNASSSFISSYIGGDSSGGGGSGGRNSDGDSSKSQIPTKSQSFLFSSVPKTVSLSSSFSPHSSPSSSSLYQPSPTSPSSPSPKSVSSSSSSASIVSSNITSSPIPTLLNRSIFSTLLNILPSLLGTVWLAPDLQMFMALLVSLLPYSSTTRSDILEKAISSSIKPSLPNWSLSQQSDQNKGSSPFFSSPAGSSATVSLRQYHILYILLLFAELLLSKNSITSNVNLFVAVFSNRIMLFFQGVPPSIACVALRLLVQMLIRRPSFAIQFNNNRGFHHLSHLLLPFALYNHVYTTLFCLLTNNLNVLVSHAITSSVTPSGQLLFPSLVSVAPSSKRSVEEFTLRSVLSPPNTLTTMPCPSVLHVILYLLENVHILVHLSFDGRIHQCIGIATSSSSSSSSNNNYSSDEVPIKTLAISPLFHPTSYTPRQLISSSSSSSSYSPTPSFGQAVSLFSYDTDFFSSQNVSSGFLGLWDPEHLSNGTFSHFPHVHSSEWQSIIFPCFPHNIPKLAGNILHTVTDGLIALPQLAIASAINPATNNANVTSTPASPDDEVKTLFPDEIIKIFFDYLLFVPKIDNIRIQSVLFSPYFASNMVVDDFLDPDITSTQTPEREISSPSGSLQALSQNKCSLARSVVYLVEDPNTPNNGGETPKGNKDASQLTNPRSSLSLETSPMLTNQITYLQPPICRGVESLYSLIEECLLFSLKTAVPSTVTKDSNAPQPPGSLGSPMAYVFNKILESVDVALPSPMIRQFNTRIMHNFIIALTARINDNPKLFTNHYNLLANTVDTCAHLANCFYASTIIIDRTCLIRLICSLSTVIQSTLPSSLKFNQPIIPYPQTQQDTQSFHKSVIHSNPPSIPALWGSLLDCSYFYYETTIDLNSWKDDCYFGFGWEEESNDAREGGGKGGGLTSFEEDTASEEYPVDVSISSSAKNEPISRSIDFSDFSSPLTIKQQEPSLSRKGFRLSSRISVMFIGNVRAEIEKNKGGNKLSGDNTVTPIPPTFTQTKVRFQNSSNQKEVDFSQNKGSNNFHIPSKLCIPTPPSHSSPSHEARKDVKPVFSSSPPSSSSSLSRLSLVPGALLASLEGENIKFPICLSDILDFTNTSASQSKKDMKLNDRLFFTLLLNLRLVIRAYIRKVTTIFRFSRTSVIHLLRTIHSLRVPLFVYYAPSSGLFISHILSANSRASSVVGADADSPWFDVQNVSSSEFKVKDMSVIVKDDDTRIFLSIMIILSFALLENYQLRDLWIQNSVLNMLSYICGTQTALVYSMFNFSDKEKGKDKEEQKPRSFLSSGLSFFPTATQLCVELMYPPYFFTPVSSSVQPQKEGSGVSPHTSGASTPLSSSPSPQQQQQNSPSSGLKTQSPYSSVNFSTVGSNVNESLYIPSSATTDLLGISYSAYVSDTTSSLMGAKEEGFNFNHLQFKNRIKSLEKLKV